MRTRSITLVPVRTTGTNNFAVVVAEGMVTIRCSCQVSIQGPVELGR